MPLPPSSRTLFLKPSRRLILLLVLAHFVAMVSLLVAAIPEWLLIGLGLLVLLSLVRFLMRSLGARRYASLTLQPDGTLVYALENGESGWVRVDAQSTLMPWLVVLLMRDDRQRGLSLTLLPDALSAEDFRQLRLWLRWRVNFPAEESRQ